MEKIVIFSDGAGDIPPEIVEKYNVQQMYGVITIDGTEYIDKVEISPALMFDLAKETKSLPKTSAVNIGSYNEGFKPFIDEGYGIVVINISNKISMCYHNALTASKEYEGVYVVDSLSLSSGLAHLVIEAGEMVNKGMSAKEIYENLIILRGKVHTSFVLDTLEYMAAGGRCSSITAFGANLLSIKPCIEMDSAGQLQVMKKYRGNLSKVIPEYVTDQLTNNPNIRTDKIFITYSTATTEIVDITREAINSVAKFENIYETTASCTIATHCGPATLGILYMVE